MKPASYPFLAIAKKYGVDYGDVLLLADMWRLSNEGVHPDNAWWRDAMDRVGKAVKWSDDFRNEVQDANETFRCIQAGGIDWLTGEITHAH